MVGGLCSLSSVGTTKRLVSVINNNDGGSIKLLCFAPFQEFGSFRGTGNVVMRVSSPSSLTMACRSEVDNPGLLIVEVLVQ